MDMFKVADYVEKVAQDKILNAGYAGEMGDGGGGNLLNEVAAWRAGMTGILPSRWETRGENFVKGYLRESDPEYSEYLRLKERFE